MNQRRITTNIFSALCEVLTTGVVLFIQYTYLARVLGLELLGAWAIVLALSNAVRVGQVGLATTPVRFVSKYRAKGDERQSQLMATTAVVSVAGIMAVLLFASYPILVAIAGAVVETEQIHQLVNVLPVVLFGTWLMTVGASAQSCLEGAERIDLRSGSAVAGSLAQLTTIFFLVPSLDLFGVAIAFVVNGFTVLVSAVLLCRKSTGLLRFIRPVVSWGCFKEMLIYGTHVQVTGIAQLLLLPATKLFLAKFGGLTSVGIFELAHRLIAQARLLLIGANKTLVPVFARLHENSKSEAENLYSRSYELFFTLSFPVFTGITILSPIVGQIMIGEAYIEFVIYTYVISLGYLVNTLSGPAYFANLGVGNPRANAIGDACTSMGNLGLGFLLGYHFGSIGVVIAYSLAQFIGSFIVISSYLRDREEVRIVPNEAVSLATVSVATSLCSLLIYFYYREYILPAQILFVVLIVAVWWMHPSRRILLSAVRLSGGRNAW